MLTAEHLHLIDHLAREVAQRRLTQIGLSKDTGVDQSQISRILAGRAKRLSGNVRKLCEYAKNHVGASGTVPEPTSALKVLAPLYGHSTLEDADLAEVLSSLVLWRQTWGAEPAQAATKVSS